MSARYLAVVFCVYSLGKANAGQDQLLFGPGLGRFSHHSERKSRSTEMRF